ncbi:MAG: RecX family transcriptional regulator [Firmicutes bacterium]|nr:RecX family transcriptional regulator [Bacillota bacterium]
MRYKNYRGDGNMTDADIEAGAVAPELTLSSVRDGYDGLTVKIEISEGESVRRQISVVKEDFDALGLSLGDLIDEEAYGILAESGEVSEAVRAGMRLLSVGDKSKKMLRDSLCHRGFGRDAAARAVDYIDGRGYIDEERGICRRAEISLRKGYGPSKVIADLHSRGFAPEKIEAWMRGAGAKIDYDRMCAEQIKKLGGIPYEIEEKRRVISRLYRIGYGSEQIKGAAKIIKEEAGD